MRGRDFKIKRVKEIVKEGNTAIEEVVSYFIYSIKYI